MDTFGNQDLEEPLRGVIGQSDMELLPRLNVSEDDAKQVFGGRRSVAVTGNVDWPP